MSKEKQIEEMARAMCAYYGTEKCYDCRYCCDCHIAKEADRLYNAGYRKQSEGEWIQDVIAFCNVCSLCKAKVDRYAIVCNSGKLNFCPNCGAKMKGGAE